MLFIRHVIILIVTPFILVCMQNSSLGNKKSCGIGAHKGIEALKAVNTFTLRLVIKVLLVYPRSQESINQFEITQYFLM